MATQIDDMISVEMCIAKDTLSKMVARVERFILPALDVAHDMQSVYGNINLKKSGRTYGTMWSTNVCVNASTGEFHTEKDTSYTLITVPLQDYKLQQKCGNVYKFPFKLNNNECISLPSTPDVSFMFYGTFLSHHQTGNSSIRINECYQGYNIQSVISM